MEEFLSKAPEELWTGIYTFLGAFLALLFGLIHARSTKLNDNVYMLLEKWHAPEMLEARQGAVAILKEWAQKEERDMQKLRSELSKDESLYLSRVVHFLELVSALAKNRQVNRKLLRELLGDYFGRAFTTD
jgi:hypothetical protein